MQRSLFRAEVWKPALEKYASVTHLTVILYGGDGQIVCGPINPTPLFGVLGLGPADPGLFGECARGCLRHAEATSTIITAKRSGLAVVGTPLTLNGEIVGAAVAGYHFVDFPQTVAIERLARESGISATHLWDIARQETPLSMSRFIVEGELLQVLGDAILREAYRTHLHEEAGVELRAAAAAKDEFLAVLSHELRTPLTPILGWARMLKLGADRARVERAADVIERNALLQTKLVDDLLELTRVARGKVALDLRVSDLNDAIHSAVEPFLDAAKQKEVALQIVDAGEPLLVQADANRLQQIFRNLLSNAIKFTRAGDRIDVSLTKAGDAAAVTIRDTGEGISPAFLPFVFDIFRQQEQGTRRRHEGLGIGLALVKRLTELQGGEVTIASAGAGHGTEATIRFPLVAGLDVTVPARPPGASVAPRELHGLLVLVVEDMDDAREATALLLERLGAHVLLAKDGVEALEIVGAVAPDVVLCDLRMPRMDGFEFIRALHDAPGIAHPPIIAVSGLASREDHRRTERAGFDGHLDKPFDDAGLLAAVGAAVARRR